MSVNRYYSSIAVDTTLASAATGSDTTIVVSATTGFPTSYPYTLAIDYDTSKEELINVIGAAGTTLTVGTVIGTASTTGRGVDGTTAQSHSVGATVKHVISGRDMREAQEHIAASTSVHGITDTAGLVTKTGTETLTNKTLTSPAISGGSITGTVGGNPTFSGTVTLPSTTSIGTVSSTELGYVDGVTSAIQTQLNAKASATGVVSSFNGVTGAVTGVSSVNGSTGAITGLATTASPTFTGNVVLPSTTTIGNVSSTELGYVDGVTSSIQTQLDSKVNSTGGQLFATFVQVDTGLVTAQGSPTTYSATTNPVTSAALLGGIVIATGSGGYTFTLPTGSDLGTASGMSTNYSFDWSLINNSGNSVTIFANTNHAIYPSSISVAAGTSALFRSRMTASGSATTYRIG